LPTVTPGKTVSAQTVTPEWAFPFGRSICNGVTCFASPSGQHDYEPSSELGSSPEEHMKVPPLPQDQSDQLFRQGGQAALINDGHINNLSSSRSSHQHPFHHTHLQIAAKTSANARSRCTGHQSFG